MFGKTWRWAGTLRRSDKNIGVDWLMIAVETQQLLDDVAYQLENKVYAQDEITARLHHRLVAIHLFPNGNGRHARLVADVLLMIHQEKRFSWGMHRCSDLDSTRKTYIMALREADKHNYQPLLEFVRS